MAYAISKFMINYKEIPEYPEYLISEYGEVYSTKTNKVLKARPNTRGYLQFAVTYNNISTFLLVSRCVARVWGELPSLTSELEVDHNDGNIVNNYYLNLVVRSKEEHIQKTLLQNNWQARKDTCPSCGKVKTSTAKLCSTCVKPSREITIEQIEYWVLNYSWVRAAKELGLSDNGLRKRYKSLTGKDPKSIKASLAQR